MNLQGKSQSKRKILSKTDIKTQDLINLLNSIEITSTDIQKYHQPIRKTLMDAESYLIILDWKLCWQLTRGYPCAPHDHAIQIQQFESYRVVPDIISMKSKKKSSLKYFPRRKVKVKYSYVLPNKFMRWEMMA